MSAQQEILYPERFQPTAANAGNVAVSEGPCWSATQPSTSSNNATNTNASTAEASVPRVESKKRYLSLDESFKLGYGLSVREDVADAKEWDYKGRTALEARPFRFPVHPLETVWRRPPNRNLATLYKPWKAEVSLYDANVQSTYPTDSTSFSTQDFVISDEHKKLLEQRPSTAPLMPSLTSAVQSSTQSQTQAQSQCQTQTKKPSVIRPRPGPPPLPCPRPGTAPHNTLILRRTAGEAELENLPVLAQPRGKDPNIIHTGYRLIERAGKQLFKDAVTYEIDVPYMERPAIKVHLKELEEKERRWQERQQQLEQDKETSLSGQADDQLHKTGSSIGPNPVTTGISESGESGKREIPYDPFNAFAAAEMKRAAQERSSAQETVARIAAQRGFPRPPPPHPLWKTTYMSYGVIPEYSRVPPTTMRYPRLQSFSNSFQYQRVGPPRNRGLNTHVSREEREKWY